MSRKRFLAVILAMVIILPFIYMAVEMDHDHDGNECHVCIAIAECETLIRHMGQGFLMAVMLLFMAYMAIMAVHDKYTHIYVGETLVSQKVRMDD